jgi:predicted membrane-bound spermidine synthase/tetratricopeptide (TPR) repeat protein
MASSTRQRGLVLLALFLSGLAGLMHEVVWAKLLANLTGSTAKAHAVVLGVFMGGLALGAVIFGRRSDKRERPLMVYVVLEVLIGLYCIALPWLAGVAGSMYESVAAATFEQSGLKTVLRLFLSLAVITIPAVMMGGTLPVLARYLVQEVAQTRKAVASLYALNNIGAVIGSGVAGFYLLPEFGIYGSLIAASSLNFIAAGIVWLADARTTIGDQPAVHEAPPTEHYTRGQFSATLWALALGGFAAMGYEIVYLRIIALGFGSSTFSFTVMLMCFITGIGLGSGVISLVNVKRPLALLAVTQFGVIVTVLLSTYAIEHLPYWVSSMRTGLLDWSDDPMELWANGEKAYGFERFLAGQALICFFMLILPTMLIGMGFPLVSQIQARSAASIGSTVGSTYAWNTIGNVLGVTVTSLFLMPNLGIDGALHFNIALNLAAAVLLLFAATEFPLVKRFATLVATLAVIGFYSGNLSHWHKTLNYAEGHLRLRRPLPSDLADNELIRSRYPATSFEAWKLKHVRNDDPKGDGWDRLELYEDADATVMCAQRDRNVGLYINSKGDASTGALDMITFVLSGHIPMLFNTDAKDVMVIGHGSGVTTGAMALHPSVERIDVVEISGAVLEADEMFAPYNHQVLSNPKTHVYQDDARTFLRTVPRKYDLIVSQPSNPWIAGIGSLFTDDFYRDCKARLNPGGVMMVWFHHYEQSNETIELIVRTINSEFPFVECFMTHESDVIGLASMEPLKIDFARMEERFELPEIRQDLARVTCFNLATLLAYHGMTASHFRALSGAGPLNTDDHQLLEYKGARNMFVGRNADLLVMDPGFDFKPDGTSEEHFLDRYIAWRAEQGEPVNAEEMSVAYDMVRNIMLADHRCTKLLESRAQAAAANTQPSQRPSRGARVPLEEMAFSEAFNWGQWMFPRHGPEVGLSYFRRAAECEPANALAATTIANVLSSLGRTEEAAAELQRVTEAGTRRTDPKLLLAQFALRAGQFDRANRLLVELVDYEEHPVALQILGELAGMREDYGVALEYWKRALERDSRLIEVSLNYIYLLKDRALNTVGIDEKVKTAQLELAYSEALWAVFKHPGDVRAVERLREIQPLVRR